jgi:DnaJ family protein A protein 2
LTALAGGQIYIEHLDDRWLTVNIYPGEPITPGKFARFPGSKISPQLTRTRSHQSDQGSGNAIAKTP